MERVLVLGSGGAGKSTFARRLGERTGLPVVHLDAFYWKAGWIETPKEEWARVVDELLARPRWVMDGNYGGTLERRLAAADTVVFLDMPRAVCLRRVLGRRLRYHNRVRPDMSEGCPERMDWEFVRWIWNYPGTQRPRIVERLERVAPGQRVVVLRSQREQEAFLEDQRTAPGSSPAPPP